MSEMMMIIYICMCVCVYVCVCVCGPREREGSNKNDSWILRTVLFYIITIIKKKRMWNRQTLCVKKRRRKRTHEHWGVRRCIQELEECIKKSKKRLIPAANHCSGNISRDKKQQKLENRNLKNNYMDIISGKLARFHT